ncbi:Cilia- and flagella-associated protein 57 [Clydaea vesicula]|uniref:Cilia- and flagella-associated protein 57 n=1 Tax=Clydaea vesicula TaxID=447962 RepID=A0AAD5UB58_9FUNG|nr:Cilia- and flagella-associated protein 57 [Clydaea vesicula]
MATRGKKSSYQFRQNLSFQADTPNFLKKLQNAEDEKKVTKPKEEANPNVNDELPSIEIGKSGISETEAKLFLELQHGADPEKRGLKRKELEDFKNLRKDEEIDLKKNQICEIGSNSKIKKAKNAKQPDKNISSKKIKNSNLLSFGDEEEAQVFGLKQDIKDNLYTVDDETILYPAGSNVLITQKGHRKFISVTEKGDSISSLTVSPDRHFLAIGEKGSRPSINVFDITSIRKRRTLYACSETISAKEFISLGFSSDSKYMAAQLCGPEWILHYYAWDKGKLIATINSHSDNPESTVLQVSVNPSDGTVIFVLGDNFVKQYRYTEGELLKIEVDVPKNVSNSIFKTHSWLNGDFVAIGTEDGKVLILNPGGSITQEIQINSTFLSKISLPASNNPSVMNQNICSSTHQMQQNLGASQSNSNFSIESIVVTNTGLIAGSKNGNIVCFDNSTDIETGNRKYIPNKKFLVPDGGVVRTMAIASTEAHLLVELESNQILKIPLIIKQEEQFDEIKFEAISEAFHHGQILGLDLCCRKPLLVTCSNDKSIRLWNYVTGQCELIKYYPEEAYSVSLHPSGLYLLVGFSDKLRFLNVLMDDFRFFKEFSIRGCKECKFSNGGHIFAAVHGNTIQVYSTWTFENICVLKGHNGKVKSLYWSPDDNFIVSAGADGAIYTWNIRDLKRESEYILKTCAFSSAICTPNGKVVYAVGSDKMVKEITESQVTCEFDGGIVATQICLSHSGKMLFVGTANGSIRSIKFPFTSDPDSFQEHFAHSGAITNLRMSFDDQYLFSASEDGCIYSFRVSEKEERGIKRERILLFADEILITKSDLEEKNVLMTEMQSTFNELKLEHEYQLRLKDLSFTDKLKELTETYSQEIEGLKILTSVLRTVKDKEEVKHEEEVMHVKATHGQELHEIESKYNSQLMAEYDKFQEAQTLMAMHQEDWLGQVKEFEFITQKMLQDTQAEYENKLKLKSAEISRLQEEMRQDSNEFAEMIRQNEEDIDIEIANLINKYEKKLRIEKDEGARLKGENGIMRKKFNTLTKDIDDNKSEIEKMRDDEKKLNFVISTLEKEILGLKKEVNSKNTVYFKLKLL